MSLNPAYYTYLCPIFVPEWVSINRVDGDIAQPYLPLLIFPQDGGSLRSCAVNQGWMKVNLAETTKLQWRIQSVPEWYHKMSAQWISNDLSVIFLFIIITGKECTERNMLVLVLAGKRNIWIGCKSQSSGYIFAPIYAFDRRVLLTIANLKDSSATCWEKFLLPPSMLPLRPSLPSEAPPLSPTDVALCEDVFVWQLGCLPEDTDTSPILKFCKHATAFSFLCVFVDLIIVILVDSGRVGRHPLCLWVTPILESCDNMVVMDTGKSLSVSLSREWNMALTRKWRFPCLHSL